VISRVELIRKDKERFRSARKIPPSGKTDFTSTLIIPHVTKTSSRMIVNNLSTIFAVLYKSIIKINIIVLSWQYRRKSEPAFSVDQLLILHVKSMFGKYGRGVAACMHF
jgi:hypothetical protein